MPTPVDYMPHVMYALDRIGQGYTKTAACDEAGLSTGTFNAYVRKIPELAPLAEEAWERHYDGLADALVHIDTSAHGSSDAKMAAVLSKNIQWYLSRRRPKEYGDKVQVEHTISMDKVITDALDRARQRAESGVPLIENVSYSRVADLSADENAELAKLY